MAATRHGSGHHHSSVMSGRWIARSVGIALWATVNGSVWRTVNAQADAARRGERNTVVVPKALPAPDWLPDYAGHRQSSEDRLHQYYDLPKNVTVVRR